MTPVHFRTLPALLVISLVAGASASAQEISWHTDYAKALKEAAQKDRLLFINVGSDDCYWCKQLDQRTFTDKDVQQLLGERFVALKINGSRNKYLVDALRIHSYPTLVFASADGNILAYKEGFVEPAALKRQLLEASASVAAPDWMRRHHKSALEAIQAGDHAQAKGLLERVVEDGKDRPVQVQARKLLAEIGKLAANATAATQEPAAQLTSRSATKSDRRQAAELLESARQEHKAGRYLICLDRCEQLADAYPETEEAKEAAKLAESIKEDDEWARRACDQMGERLAMLYLNQAETWLKKGQPQQAVYYLERVTRAFPGTRHAEQASAKLVRLRGTPETKH